MKPDFYYDSETDSLHLDLGKHPSVDSLEVAEGIVLDYDKHNKIIGIDIQHASRWLSVIDGVAESIRKSPQEIPGQRESHSIG